jgi:hypothetical protein
MTLKISGILRAKLTESGECIKASKAEQLCENLLDSGIVGGIAWISQVVATEGDLSGLSFLIGFGLTFLIKLKEYRKIA